MKGEMTVTFSESMIDESKGFKLDKINNRTVNLTIISAATYEILNMTWEPLSF